MTLRTHFARTGFAFLLTTVVLAQTPPPTQIVPPPPETGGAYVIAVVSDGYTKGEERMFDRALNGLLINGLLSDGFFGDSKHRSAFTIHRFFKEVNNSGDSNFKIKPNYNLVGCYIDYDEDNTTTLIDQVVSGVAPERTIVIANVEGVSMGCRVGNWTYVSAGAREVGGVLEHEFGHLIANLDDEYPLTVPSQYNPPPNVSGPNCSNSPFVTPASSAGPPSWMQLPLKSTPTNPEGCQYVANKIVRPYEHCRMRSSHAAFCEVCEYFLNDSLLQYQSSALTRRDADPPLRILQAGFVPQPAGPSRPSTPPPGATADQPPAPAPPRPAGQPVPTVRVLLELTPDADGKTAKSRVLTMTDVSAPYVQRYRRTGDLVYAIVENNNFVESGFVAGDPFQERIYGGTGAPHRVGSQPEKASVVIMIPNATRQQLLGRSMSIQFFKLDPGTRTDKYGQPQSVDPQALKMKVGSREAAPLSELSAADLKKAAEQQPVQPPRGR